MKTLLQGKKYDSAANTDIRRLFKRVRRELADQQRQREQAEAEARAKTTPIRKAR